MTDVTSIIKILNETKNCQLYILTGLRPFTGVAISKGSKGETSQNQNKNASSSSSDASHYHYYATGWIQKDPPSGMIEAVKGHALSSAKLTELLETQAVAVFQGATTDPAYQKSETAGPLLMASPMYKHMVALRFGEDLANAIVQGLLMNIGCPMYSDPDNRSVITLHPFDSAELKQITIQFGQYNILEVNDEPALLSTVEQQQKVVGKGEHLSHKEQFKRAEEEAREIRVKMREYTSGTIKEQNVMPHNSLVRMFGMLESLYPLGINDVYLIILSDGSAHDTLLYQKVPEGVHVYDTANSLQGDDTLDKVRDLCRRFGTQSACTGSGCKRGLRRKRSLVT